MLKILPIMLLSSTQKVTYHAQYYAAHNYTDYATVYSYRIAGNFRREKFSESSEKNNDFRKYIS